uniref:Leucine-rich repeat-containing N-terminal plant-type domain-containing protein n=1 Tax=Leersia perrieri TaxID=77586 RepID=A0A0D9VXR9_9ORYZ
MSIVSVLLLITMLAVGGAARHLAAVKTDPSDAAAMQAIAKSTRADEAVGWGKKSADPCDGTWAGVRCDMGRVTSINASRGGLIGRLNGTDLSKLAFLTDLDLSFNGLRNDVPVLPTPLPRLVSLNLRSNSFSDIPVGFFAGFPALETFAVDDNDMIFPTISRDDVLKCSKLRSFSANNASIFGVLPNYFGNTTLFPALETLSLARNQFTGVVLAGFGYKSNIKYLDIGGQHDSDGIGRSTLIGSLDLFIPDMENLVEARFDHNALIGPALNATKLVNLRVFDASYNDLCGVPKFAEGIMLYFNSGSVTFGGGALLSDRQGGDLHSGAFPFSPRPASGHVVCLLRTGFDGQCGSLLSDGQVAATHIDGHIPATARRISARRRPLPGDIVCPLLPRLSLVK